MRQPLERTPRSVGGRPKPWVAGIASGLSVHLRVSVAIVRLVFVLLVPLGSPVLYIWLWALTPKVSEERKYRAARIARPVKEHREAPASSARNGVAYALVLLLAAAIFYAVQSGWIHLSNDWIATALLLAGIALIWVQSSSVQDWKNPMVLGLTGTGVVAVLAGVTLLLLGGGVGLFPGLILGLALIVVLALAFSPLVVRMTRELSATQVARARETERADIAAHLHDSVLQTLTLIKNNADNPASVRSLALKQERELRAWLYTGAEQTTTSVRRLLETSIEAVEELYGVEIETVAVGDAVPGPNEQAAIAAATEAAKNAARHGAPPIQIYAELGDQYDIYIKDAGPGFDLANMPPDRHGVRDSIIARTERAGGRVEIRTLNPGTEIHISVPRSEKMKP
ncbi:ATP-binding protein [Gleimia europaea]|uniref:Phage shock protein PspC N-terminal domain-containing protein n=1 Tax=Gleimia europaea ACS-120-V-Col10b TaxID=883069 RepID=A0A9W5VVS7_9ACTO|nr:ATP-binding protein [Gleimia europaea]EPD29477.1 hypothetical protein HMPREF9238_01457 [Gleimia europaea ACS-120-V-Col10b]